MSEFSVKHKGGKWWHVDGGLSLTKKRLGEFLYAALSDNEIHVGEFWAFATSHGAQVLVPVLCTDAAKTRLESKCPWLKLIVPPRVNLNAENY